MGGSAAGGVGSRNESMMGGSLGVGGTGVRWGSVVVTLPEDEEEAAALFKTD